MTHTHPIEDDMTPERFDQLLTERLHKIKGVLANKAGEYATQADRLHNFRVGAAITGLTPFQTLGAYMAKHVASVYKLIEDQRRGVPILPHVVDEKIGDVINYLILLEALFKETETG